MMDGEMQNVEYLVKSVLAYYRIPVHQWGMKLEEWRKPVVEAAAIVTREYAPPEDALPVPPEEHPLNCECVGYLSPAPRYAKLGRGVA